MAGDTTFTFLDATSVTKTAHAGSDVGGNLAPSAVLYDVNGAVLIGQDARAASLPVALSTEDAALLADLLTNTAFQARTPTNGQKAMAGSLPVVIASDQTAIATTVASLPLPSGAATEATLSALNTKIPAAPATAANQTTGNASLSSIDTKTPALGQALAAASVPVILPSATITTLTPPAAITGFALETTQTTQSGLYGALTETAPATDTASSGLNGRLQRIAQRLTSLITALGSPFQAGGSIGNTTFGATQSGAWNITNVSGTVSLPTGAATEATLATRLTESDFDTKIGSLTETAPATDTASSGLNGRLQRIAQRITSMIALMPASLGQKTMANSYAVTIASDQTVIPVSQSGTWTVQPGNTANTTAWLIDARGNVASGAADSGNPVKVGGRYNSTPPTLTDGQRGDVQLDASGNLKINLATRLDSTNDSVNVGKWFGDTPLKEFTIAASAVRSATVSFDIVKPQGATGLHIWFDVTAVPTVDTVTLSLVGRDATTTAKAKTLWSGPGAISTVSTGYFGIGAGNSGGNMSSVTGCILPLNVRVTVTHSAATNFTYAIGGCWI